MLGGPSTAALGLSDSGDNSRSTDQLTISSGPEDTLLQVDNQTGDGNETVRHQNPDDSGEDGDLGGLESWLSGKLASQLGDSAVQLSEGEYELAQDFIGDEYRERFEQYVDVAGETDGESSEETFRQARDNQEELTNLLEEYDETRESYEAAAEAGETERARELARELSTLADDIDTTNRNLQDRYDELENITDQDLSEPKTAIAEINEETQLEVSEVLSTEFTQTDLQIEAEQEIISFLNPLTTTGELSAAEGEPISNESIKLAVGNTTVRVETNDDGVFQLIYRPTELPLATSSLSVQYVPDNQSTYLGSETSVNISVEQVEPSINNVDGPSALAYAETAEVSGELVVDGSPVDGVSVEIDIAGQQVGTAEVSDGSFNGTVTLPTTIPDGEQTLVVRLADRDRALAGASSTQAVTIRETETMLTVNATQVGGETINLTGTLETISGVGVGGEPVQVRSDGTTIGTVTTTTDGTFVETITVPGTGTGETVRLQVSYQASNSNLESADAETSVEIESGDSGGDSTQSSGPIETAFSDTGIPVWAWFAGIIGIISLVSVLLWIGRYGSDKIPFSEHPVAQMIIGPIQRLTGTPDRDSSQVEREPQATGEEQSGPTVVASLLEHASEQLQAEQSDLAVRACYSAVRQDLGTRIDTSVALTHWEFYRTYHDTDNIDEDDSATNALQTVTEAYERAMFSGEDVSAETAQHVFEYTQQLCHIDDTMSPKTNSTADD